MSTNISTTATGKQVTTVNNAANPLAYMKALASLVGAIATGLLAVYASDSDIGQILTVVAIIATAITTWVVPNAPVVPDDIIVETETDDGLTYEESGGLPFPTDADEGSLYGKPGTLREGGDDTPYTGDEPNRAY